jgi:hypothetical protein
MLPARKALDLKVRVSYLLFYLHATIKHFALIEDASLLVKGLKQAVASCYDHFQSFRTSSFWRGVSTRFLPSNNSTSRDFTSERRLGRLLHPVPLLSSLA